MLGNLSFTRRNLINFFIKNLHFFFIEYLFQIYCILSLEWSSKCSSTWFAAILDMPSHHVEIWALCSCFLCHARSGGDRNNNCGARNWSTAGHKRRERKAEFIYFVKEMYNTWAWGKLNSVDFCTSTHIMCYSFVFSLFETSIFCVSLPISHSIFFSLDCFIKRNGSSPNTLN